MAAGTITDVAGMFTDELFSKVLQSELVETTNLVNGFAMDSNMIQPNSGDFGSVPIYSMPTEASTPITSGSDATINKVGVTKTGSVWLNREIAFGEEQIINLITGWNRGGVEEAVSIITPLMTRCLNDHINDTITGIFGASSMSTHIQGGITSTINIVDIMKAKQYVCGDFQNELDTIVMNSKVYTDAAQSFVQTYDNYNRDGAKTGQITSFAGLRPLQDDELAVGADSSYLSYIGKKGAVQFKYRPYSMVKPQLSNANVFDVGGIRVELERNAKNSGGIDNIYFRYSVLVAVPGVQWNVTTTNPTNAQLRTGSNWLKTVPNDKLIKLIQFQSL